MERPEGLRWQRPQRAHSGHKERLGEDAGGVGGVVRAEEGRRVSRKGSTVTRLRAKRGEL